MNRYSIYASFYSHMRYTCRQIFSMIMRETLPVMSLKRGRAALRRSMNARFKITSHFRVLGLEVKVLK